MRLVIVKVDGTVEPCVDDIEEFDLRTPSAQKVVIDAVRSTLRIVAQEEADELGELLSSAASENAGIPVHVTVPPREV